MSRRQFSRNSFISMLLVLTALFLSAVVGTGQSHSKEKFTSKEGGFAVKLPGEPKEKSENLETKNGPTTLHTFMIEIDGGKTFYLVGYSDYQTKLDEEVSVDGVIAAQVESMKGKITSDKKATLRGHPGRSVIIEDEQNRFYSAVYVAGNRLYQVMYGMPKSDSLPAEAQEFLDSFEILI